MKKKAKRRVRWNRVLLLVITFILCMSFAVNVLADSSSLNYTIVKVGSGDTLWSLIKENNPGYCGNMNEAIYKTYAINNMNTSKITIGQNLLIPEL